MKEERGEAQGPPEQQPPLRRSLEEYKKTWGNIAKALGISMGHLSVEEVLELGRTLDELDRELEANVPEYARLHPQAKPEIEG